MVNYGNSFPIKKKDKAMKKIYINPDLKIVKINTTCLLMDTSMQMRGNYNSETITIGSRRGGNDLWDDEDDDY